MTDFTVASPDERTLAAGEFLLGALLLALILSPIAWAAWRLRATLLPAWTGAPARIAEVTLALAGLILLSQLLGTFGAFATAPMIIGAFTTAIAVAIVCGKRDASGPGGWWGDLREAGSHNFTCCSRRRTASRQHTRRKSQEIAPPPAHATSADSGHERPGATATPPAPPSARTAVAIAIAACAALAAAWAIPTLISIAGGMGRADTLWYHMPLSTRFAQTGSLTDIFHFDPIFLAAYYPASSSVLHAVPILAFDRDIVSPLLNLGFVALGLAAAWSIGRPWGLGPQALLGGAIAFGAQMLVEFQAGQALNDVVGTALILVAVAILVNAHTAVPRGSAAPAVAVAGLAGGLAAGMKLSFLAPVGALFIGLVVIAGRGERLRTAAWFGVPALIAGGYWYARNLLAVGNPVPMVSSIGPIELPGPERTFELRPGFSVAHYWNEPGVWAEWFFPGLADSFGVLWPLTLLAMVGGAVYALWRGGDPLIRVLGAVVLVTAVAYLVTPLTAAGEEGEPISFVWNVRYMAPAAAIGLGLLPCLPALRETPWRRAVTTVGITALLATTVGSLVQWQQGHVRGAIAAAVLTLVALALVAWLRSSTRLDLRARRWVAVGLGAAALLTGLAAGWVGQDHYLERRYQTLSPERHIAEAARFGTNLRDARVAVSGVRGVFNQYPFYGTDLSNHVQWLGYEDEDGGFRRLPTCEDWRATLRDGRYTHVVTMYDPFNPGGLTDTKEGLWTREDPAAEEIIRDGPVSVFELTEAPDPDRCDELPPLSEPELTGDSVNRVPMANDPGFSR